MNRVRSAITFAILFLLSLPMAGRADVITDWNLAATNATANLGPVVQARVLATAHAAAFDAVNAIERRYTPNLHEFKPSENTSADAAAAAALHGVLVTMLPALKNTFDEQLNSTLAKIPDGLAKDAGIAFGSQVAQAYVEYRSKDGMTATAEHKAGMNPGQRRPTPPANAPMAAPQLADVVPFTTQKFDFLQVKGPPASIAPPMRATWMKCVAWVRASRRSEPPIRPSRQFSGTSARLSRGKLLLGPAHRNST
jgi:hypothetical protein